MILCGTDLSVASEPASKAAAAIARKQGADLLLVSVVERPDADRLMQTDLRLEQEAGELRREFGISLETVVGRGIPENMLLELARARRARLIVVGAVGDSKRARRLGSVTEGLCQKCEVPVLVARNADPFMAWSQGSRPLAVVVGSGLGDTSRSALECVGAWQDLALTIAHVAWPFGEHYRLGLAGPMPLDHLRPEVHHQLLGELGRLASETRCEAPPKLSVSPGYGRIDSHLAQIAHEKRADLLVVGTHQRNWASRLWHGSVSRSVIHEAECNVLCVPQLAGSARPHQAPRTLVVPTDFSPLADRAIAYAYALLLEGGTVHLVHVASSLKEVDEPALRAQLAARIPEDAASRGIVTQVSVLEGGTAWLSVWQHASRVTADLICMATHSRDAAKSLVIGSQAQALLQHCRIPVLLVPPDRES
jgi:nucleotide-binding universal stress UspA family protein